MFLLNGTYFGLIVVVVLNLDSNILLAFHNMEYLFNNVIDVDWVIARESLGVYLKKINHQLPGNYVAIMSCIRHPQVRNIFLCQFIYVNPINNALSNIDY